MLSLVDYELALYYAIETYIRRDMWFIMSKIYGKKETSNDKSMKLVIEHPEIEQWIKEQYEDKK